MTPGPVGRRVALAGVSALLVAATATIAFAQFERFYGGFRRVPPKFAAPDTFEGAFNFCRVMYQSTRREEGGMGWWTDYPDSDLNFSIRFSELTKAPVGREAGGEPKHIVVPITDPAMFQCPFLMIEDAGTAQFTDEEVTRLREYLLKGGFLWSDDFWGSRAWEQWVREIRRVLPADRYPILDLPPEHPMFKTLFELKAVPQIPSIQFWRRSGGATSERGSDSDRVDVKGIADERGRVMVFMTHNTDISDAWEREGEDPRFFYRFSVDGYAVGIDALIYAMSH